MSGVCLKLYVSEAERHHGILLYEWILEQAHKSGIPGGTAFRAVAGYGRHGNLHEQHFFELAGELPVQLEFVTSEQSARELLALLAKNGISVFYQLLPSEFGITK